MKVSKKIFRKIDKRIRKRSVWNSIPEMTPPRTVIDIGCAYETKALYDAFPAASLFLVDPVAEYVPHMWDLTQRRGGRYANVAVGATDGTVTVNVNLRDPKKSSAFTRTPLARKKGSEDQRELPLYQLDTLIGEMDLDPPYVLKIDTEGNELNVLKGARQTLRACSGVIVETSVQQRFEGSYRFHEVISFMAESGFVVGNILSARADKDGWVRMVDLACVPDPLADEMPGESPG